MLNLTSADIVAHGTKLHYYRTGGAKPALILAHGITDDGLCWTPVAEALCAHYDIVMVDARGHGKSEAPADGYTLENLARELAGCVRGLSLERSVLLGHSMGAITVLLLAALFPDLPRAIILEDPPAFWNFRSMSHGQVNARDFLMEWIPSLKRKTRDDLLADCHASDPTWSETEVSFWADSKHRFSTRIVELVTPPDAAALDYPDLMKRITCPVVFISADQDRRAASSPADIAQLKGLLPQLQEAHIAGAGHSIHRDQFDRYIAVVRDALAEFYTD